MDEKIKVKDLATELGVSSKDLVRVLREMDVEVRSSASSVSTEVAAKAKTRLQPDTAAEVMRKEIEPGLIVRRRRSKDSEAAGESSSAASQEAAPEEAKEPAKASPAQQEEKLAADSPEKSSQPVEESLAPAEKPQKAEQSEAASKAEKPAKAATEAVAETAAPKAQRKSKKPQATPSAKIIVPAPVESPAQPEAIAQAPKAAAAPEAQAPQEAKVEKSQAKAPAAATEATAKVTEAPKAEKEAQPKKEAAAPQAESKSEAESAEARPERERRSPAASAVPEGSSRPSLLPPPGEGRRNRDEEEDKAAAPQEVKAHSGGARIISRPDPSQARVIIPAPTNSRDSRDSRDNRRPAPGAARPGGPRPSGPGRPGGAPRPGAAGRPGGFMPSFEAPQAPVDGGDQSRKKRNKGRRTVDFSQGDFSRRSSHDNEDMLGRSRNRGRKSKKNQNIPVSTQPMKAAKRKIRMEEAIRVADLAHQMGIKSNEIIKVLFGLGIMATINNSLDIDTATLVAAEFDYEVEKVGFSEDTFLSPTETDSPESLLPRPPVVTIMGHVDHGKTSLLDAIRKTSVTSGEAGGITQHIGAYHVKTKRGDIVFLDTPGHEAFTAMRARGAQVTDLVVLVVAADDGVMEQTREAVNHSKAAGVPILVAVNKMDKEGANPDRVLRELSEMGLQAESWGGDTVVGYVSAKTGEGLDELLELIALQAEIMELKANPNKAARGHVVEAKLDKGRGPVATVLIQEGTLHQGDAFVCGVFAGRVRALFNDQGRKIKEAGPSRPVEIQGFEGVPEAGEEFVSLADEKTARRIAEARAVKQRERELARESRVTLETFLSRSASDTETLVLNLVLKADVQGSLEAITDALIKLNTEKVRISVIHSGAGAISETDIMLAAASNAIIIGFNVRPTAKVKDVAEQEHVEIRFYDIIYKLVEEIKSAMAGMLAPVTREVYLGQAEVRDTFTLPKVGAIAGCYVADGKIVRNAGVRLLRDGVVTYTGKISSLKRFKDDAKEVPKGMECGLGLENFNDIKVGDIIEAFETVEEAATLD